MMDYEKKYKEALELAKSYYGKGHNEFLDSMFPELAESEDEKTRKGLIKLLTVASDAYLVESTGIKKDAYLAWLEKQKEQKPAEWSEEGERMRDRVIDILNRTFSVYSALGTSSTRPSCPTYKDEIDWLKSLRPQPRWKPSEEQIGALDYAYCELFKRKDVGHNILGPLQKLCDELKKLM